VYRWSSGTIRSPIDETPRIMAMWIALYTPKLPLQAACRGLLIDLPLVIADGPEARPIVFAANIAARQLGIQEGLNISSARALSAELIVLPRSSEAEQRAIEQIALTALAFTPAVSIATAAVLLEVSSSLRLFGGLGTLLGRIKTAVAATGFQVVIGAAPTPLAAWLIAKTRTRHAATRSARTLEALPGRLADIPLANFEWSRATIQALATLGIVRIRDMARLPRDGVDRRFGEDVIADLDRALGKRGDPRKYFAAPEKFYGAIELVRETDDAAQLLIACERLFADLLTFLRARGAAASELNLTFTQGRGKSASLLLATRESARDVKRWRLLAKEKLAQLRLNDDVYAVSLRVDQLQPCQLASESFLPEAKSSAGNMDRLAEQLAARLGEQSVFTIALRDEHRPELAWCVNDDATSSRGKPTPPTRAARPAFLLEHPRALLIENDAPRHHGTLTLLVGPERIETGWWDGKPARRDYYVVRNTSGETLWLYRDLSRHGEWMLHGIFA
jgi:protein ImuB